MKRNMLLASLCTFALAASPQQPTSVETPITVSGNSVSRTSQILVKPYRNHVSKRNVILSRQIPAEILKTQKVSDAIELQLVRDARGFVYKRVIDLNKSDRFALSHLPSYSPDQDSNTTLYEDFESWDASTDSELTWLPDGWKEQNSQAVLDITSYDFSWFVYYSGGSGFLPPTPDGEKEIFIHCSYSNIVEGKPELSYDGVNQDEWLLTPEITVKENENLYFLLAADYHAFYDQEFWSYDTYTFSERKVVNTLKIMISEDGGEWKEVWDIEKKYASQLSDMDLYNTPFEYRPYQIDLTAYKGKNIQIAFRYICNGLGKWWTGNSMCLDAIMVGIPRPEALYQRPDGMFFYGFSKDLTYLPDGYLHGPAFAASQWNNLSDSYSQSFEWTFADDTTEGKTHTSTEKNPIQKYNFSLVQTPILKAHIDGAQDSVYQWGNWMSNGGSTWISPDDGEPILYGAGNYDPGLGIVTWSGDQEDNFLFGKPAPEETLWEGTFSGITTVYYKPVTPYVISELWFTANANLFDVDKDAELKLEIFEIDDEGYINNEAIVSSNCVLDKDKIEIKDTEGNTECYQIPFKFKDPGYVEIKNAILVKISGFESDKIRKLVPLSQYEDMPTQENTAGAVILTSDENGDILENYYSLTDFYSPLLINMDVTYSFLFAENSKFTAPTEGGSQEFEVNSYYKTEAWTIDEIDQIPDWLTVHYEDGAYGKGILTLTAEKLESNKGRKFEFTLRAPGASQKFTVEQGDISGISQTEAHAVKIEYQGEDILLSYPIEITSVTCYTADGHQIGTFELPDTGHSLLKTAHWTNGVYLLKFNNHEIIKIVK